MSRYIPLWKRKIPAPPVHWKGNPQHRVLLPQFWMKLVQSKKDMPNDQVNFIVHPQMNKYDIQQYLEKIYNVPVLTVKTAVKQGQDILNPKMPTHVLWRKDDYKMAYVQLKDGHTFNFPDVLKEKSSKREKYEEAQDMAEKEGKEIQEKQWDRVEIPGWFR